MAAKQRFHVGPQHDSLRYHGQNDVVSQETGHNCRDYLHHICCMPRKKSSLSRLMGSQTVRGSKVPKCTACRDFTLGIILFLETVTTGLGRYLAVRYLDP